MLENALILTLDWSEVWATMIPLLVLQFAGKQPSFLKPVVFYLCIAFLLNLFGDIVADYKIILHFPSWLQSNNPIYNLHSIIRFTCFSYFFITLQQSHYRKFYRILPLLSVLLILINFSFVDNFFYPNNLSGNLLTIEAYFLMVYCMLYYLSQLRADVETIASGPDFWVTTGLSIYVTINFFVFLFYVPMIDQNPKLADKMWSVHNVAYIILCLFIAKAFYVPTRNLYRV